MKYLRWVLLSLLAFAGGWFLVSYLTVDPLQMSLALALAMSCLFLAAGLIAWKFRGRAIAGAVAVVLLGASVGYAASAAVVLGREDDRVVPERLARPRIRATATPRSSTSPTESRPTYDPIGWLNQFREFDDQSIPFVPLIAPSCLHLACCCRAYLKVGMNQRPPA